MMTESVSGEFNCFEDLVKVICCKTKVLILHKILHICISVVQMKMHKYDK